MDRTKQTTRGGRLTKYKGKVVSCAPYVCGIVLASAVAMVPFGTDPTFASECGADGPGVTAVACTNADPDYDTYTDGIVYLNTDADLTITINDDTINVTDGMVTPGAAANGVVGATDPFATTGANKQIIINAFDFDQIKTSGDGPTETGILGQIGIDAVSTAGTTDGLASNATVIFGNNVAGTTPEIITTGREAHGIRAAVLEDANLSKPTNDADATVDLRSGTIRVTSAAGFQSNGAYALNDSALGDAIITNSGAAVITTGDAGSALFAEIRNELGTGTAAVTLSAGASITNGGSAAGAFAVHRGEGDATVRIEGGTINTDDGVDFPPIGPPENAHGAFAFKDKAASAGDATVTMTGGSVEVELSTSFGLYAANQGDGNALVNVSGDSFVASREIGGNALAAVANGSSAGNATTARITVDGDARIEASRDDDPLPMGVTRQAVSLGLAVQAGYGNAEIIVNGGSSITYEGFGYTARVQDVDGVIDDTGDAIINVNGGTIQTYGVGANVAQAVQQGNGDAMVTLGDQMLGTGPTIITTPGGNFTAPSSLSHGFALVGGLDTDRSLRTGNATAIAEEGNFDAEGTAINILYALNQAAGNATAAFNGGDADSTGLQSMIARAEVSNFDAGFLATGIAQAEMNGGTADLTNTGGLSYAIYALNSEAGAANALFGGGTLNHEGTQLVGSVVASITNATNTSAASVRMYDEGNDGAGTINTTVSNPFATDALRSFSLLARNAGLGAATVSMEAGTINFDADQGYAAFAHVSQGSNTSIARAQMTGGEINATRGSGLVAQNAGSGTALVDMDAGSINTDGTGGYGLYALATGTGMAAIEMAGGAVDTDGAMADGLRAEIQNAASGADAQAVANGGSVNTSADGSRGIAAITDGADGRAFASAADADVDTSGANAHGVFAAATGNADAVADASGGFVTTIGATSDGVRAESINGGSGNVQAQISGDADVDTSTDGSRGAFARSNGSGEVMVLMEDGNVETQGANAYGLHALVFGAGTNTAMVTMNDGVVDTNGAGADGLRAEITNAANSSNAQAFFTGGTVNTSAANARGVAVENNGAGLARIDMSNPGQVRTSGSNSHGLNALATGSGGAEIDISDGIVATTGANADGLRAESTNNSSAAAVTVALSGNAQVTTTADNSRGAVALAVGSGLAQVSIAEGTNVSVSTEGTESHGLHAFTSGSGPANVRAGEGSVSTEGAGALGMFAESTGNSAALVSVSLLGIVDVDTFGDFALGAGARSNGSGQAQVTMAGTASVETRGAGSVGLAAFSSGTGNALITMSGGTVTTAGVGADGLRAEIANAASMATAQAIASGGSIDTSADNARGIAAIGNGSGLVTAQNNGADIITRGAGSHGVYAESAGSGNADAQANGGTTTVTADGANGVYAYKSNGLAAGDAVAMVSGPGTMIDVDGDNAGGVVMQVEGSGQARGTIGGVTINAQGLRSDGVRAQSFGGGFNIDIATGTTINGGALDGLLRAGTGIKTLSSAGGTLNIATGVTVNALSNIAIRDGDLDRDGVDNDMNHSGGNLFATSAGTINGDVILGRGDDRYDLVDGLTDGNIYGDDVAASGVTDGNDAFNWTGGQLDGAYRGQDGSDTGNVFAASDYDGGNGLRSEILDGGDDVSTADGFIDVLNIFDKNFPGPGGTQAIDTQTVINWEQIHLIGGVTTFNDSVNGTATLVTGGDPGQGLFLQNGNTLNITNDLFVTGSVVHTAGTSINALNGTTGNFIDISSNYQGGGVFFTDVDFENDVADTMIIAGAVTGTSTISVANITAPPEDATGNDVLVVDVTGGSTDANDFVLAGGSVSSGTFDYQLVLDGQQWFLRVFDDVVRPPYEQTPHIWFDAMDAPTLVERVGWHRHSKDDATGDFEIKSAWTRFWGHKKDANTFHTTSGYGDYEQTVGGFQAGIDIPTEEDENGQWVFGLTLQGSTSGADVQGMSSFADVDTQAFGVGATATWYNNDGAYVDIQSQYNWLTTDYDTVTDEVLAEDVAGRLVMLSIESGHEFQLDEDISITPQWQLIGKHASGVGSFTDTRGNVVDLSSNRMLRARLGANLNFSLDEESETASSSDYAYIVTNIWHDSLSTTSVDYNGAQLKSTRESTWWEIGIGGEFHVEENVTAYLQGTYQQSVFNRHEGMDAMSANAGVMINW
jgi:outer membrane autotransporter protein